MAGALIEVPQGRPAIIVEAYQTMGLRCMCPACLRLDARFPGEGYQLALFPYRLSRPVPDREAGR